jgi:pheromone shutdown-related protein TraB
MKYKNLVVIGTSHIATESLDEVERVILSEKPTIVALELDRERFLALKTGQKRKPSIWDARKIGFKGYLFAKLGEYVERKLGDKVNISPGDEMLKASNIASKEKIKIALVDQNIKVTLKNFSKEFTWKEKFRFVGSLIKGIFKKQKIAIDLSKVPDKGFVDMAMEHLQKDYPNVYKVLVVDRNIYMAKRLVKLMHMFGKVVAVVGAGHSEGLIEEVKKRYNLVEKV